MRRLLLAFLVVSGVCLASTAAAQERILSYDSEVEIQPDGSLEVAEHITVQGEGSNIRRGIYRDFPTRYRDRFGNRVRVDLEVLGVERDGQPEPWFTERLGNGVRINTGDDSFLQVPAQYTFTIRYRTTRQLGFFDDHDELYWNAIGTGWMFPIERGTVDVSLPRPVPIDSMTVEGYTGRQGVQGADYTATLPAPGTASYALTEPLVPAEGLTIVLTFPKGVVAEPTTAERVRWFFKDNAGVLVALVGMTGVLLFCFKRWSAIGKDPRAGVIIPRYEPRPGQSPGAARYLRRMGYDDRCFTADALDLAVGGHLRIHREGEGRKDAWLLERRAPVAASRTFGRWETDPARQGLELPGGSPVPPAPSQRALLDRLFRGGVALLELEPSNATTLREARSVHRQALDEELHGPYFRRNGTSAVWAFGITAVTGALAMAVSGGSGIPFIILILFLMVGASAVFLRLVRAPTPEGRARMDEIEGLRLYMSVAERDELAAMEGPGSPPPLDATRYEALLPFAVALEVEDAWTDLFTAAVGAAAAAEAARRMRWYVGRGPVTDLGSFSRSVGSGLSSQIASASSPPGSSSGGGGGGFSGGGGGGGGGGGR